MNWKGYLAIALATAAIVATQIFCTVVMVRFGIVPIQIAVQQIEWNMHPR